MAKTALTAKAFLTSLNSSITIAADISINPDSIRNPAIDITAVSRSDNQRLKKCSPHLFVHLLNIMTSTEK